MMILISGLTAVTFLAMIAAILFPQAVQSGYLHPEKNGEKRIIDLKEVHLATRRISNGMQQTSTRMAWKILSNPPIKEVTEDRLRRARLDDQLTAVEYICIRIFLVALFTASSILLNLLVKTHIPDYLVILTIIGVFLLPDYILDRRAKNIDEKVTQELPQTIDMLLICAESGMGLVNALEVVADRSGGAIGIELKMCLQEIRLGVRLQEALYNMTKRCQTKEMQMFVNSIAQALRMGTPIQGILRNMSASIRESERQRLENMIGTIPMKLTLVTMIFFMPIIFIIVLFPSLLSFMQNGW